MSDGDDARGHHVGVSDQVRGELLVGRVSVAFAFLSETRSDALRRVSADGEMNALLDQRVEGGGAVAQQASVLG